MRYLPAVLAVALFAACQPSPKPAMPVYPETRTCDTVDTYFGISVADPYRWLEDDMAAETTEWVKAQNQVTQAYLQNIPYREKLAARARELMNFPRMGAPRKVGPYYIFSKNDGLQNQAVIYVQKGPDAAPEVLIDPNTLSEKGISAVNLIGFSKDYRYVAYSQSEAGSDWSVIRVMEIAGNRLLPDELKWVKFSGANWYGDGFFYTRYPEPVAGKEYSAQTSKSAIFYHRLGQPQDQDELIYRDSRAQNLYLYTDITHDQAYMLLYISSGTDGFETYYKKMSEPGWKFSPLFTGFSNKNSVIDHKDGRFLIRTDIDAPTYKVISLELAKPDKSAWTTVIPPKAELLENISLVGGKLFAAYLKDAASKLVQYNYDGSQPQEIELPAIGSATLSEGSPEDNELFYSFTSFVFPGSVYRYDLNAGRSELFFQAPLRFNPDDFEVKQVFYPSKDGEKVPMFLVHKKGIQLNGNNPVYLYGYGGFNVTLSPSFSVARIQLLENGFIYAIANLRGGGEYGEEWHKAGMLMQKQTVFDDFIAAAEFLIKEKYTRPEKLAIAGGSNGGLLVGACINQRPELFRAAFPAVGVMDMLRYHLFTVGWGWAPEYGTSADNEDMFRYLLGYSPLHNIREGVNYPAIFVTTADHDDRVVPAHSFKYIATLQAKHKGPHPTLIRIETDAGHGAGKPTEKVIESIADEQAFLFHELGVKPR